MTAIEVQIPFEIPPAQAAPNIAPSPLRLVVNDNGTVSGTFLLDTHADNIHVLTTCETGGPVSGASSIVFPPCSGLVTHADGSLVSFLSPAKAGEVVVIYATGLGRTSPAVMTGNVTPIPAPVLSGPTLSIQFDFRPNATPSRPYISPLSTGRVVPAPIFAGLTPGQVGLYQVNVRIPDKLPSIPGCTGLTVLPVNSYVQSNLTIDVGGESSFDGAAICVEPSQ